MLKNKKAYAVIMAGGRGERFWPVSTEEKPKPFIKLIGEQTLFQMTVERIKQLIPEDHILPVLSRQHLKLALEQVPEIPENNYIVEPTGRDTAACIGLASLYLEKLDPHAVMIVLPADHYIPDNTELIDCLIKGLEFVDKKDRIITIGIQPTRPEIGYGYIETGDSITPDILNVKRFIEKPDMVKAKEYFLKGNFYWNSGMFIWKNKLIQSLISRFMPAHWTKLKKIRDAIDTPDEKMVIDLEYNQMEKISIDYGVLEKTQNIMLIPSTFQWDDVGNWAALSRISKTDEHGNLCIGKIETMDSKDSLVFSKELPVTTFGVNGLIVVVSDNRILITTTEVAPNLKKLVKTSRARD